MRNSKKKLMLLYFIALFSLILGLGLYSFLRENTYISILMRSLLPLRNINFKLSFFDYDFFKYYFPDFLWAVSFTAWLHIVILPSKRSSFFCSMSVSILGFCFEFFQHLGIISGTADIWDIISYIFASSLISAIYLI